MAANYVPWCYLVKITKSDRESSVECGEYGRKSVMEKTNRRLSALTLLWEQTCAGREMPARSEFDVRTLKPWLGNLALIDLVQAHRGRFRLCGTNLLGRFGGEFTNRLVGELEPTIQTSIQSYLDEVCRTRSPCNGKHAQIIDGTATTFLELALPLSDFALSVETVLFASFSTKAVSA